MRITYRHQNNKEYWHQRWAQTAIDRPMTNTNIYPLKYSQMMITSEQSKILEAGCGAGRLLRYYHQKGHQITGIDFVASVIESIKETDPNLNVQTGDITNLDFKDESFDYVLSFGLYHNLESHLDQAIQETYRVLKKGGKVCASFRADNLQTLFIDLLAKRSDKKKQTEKLFHKMNLTKNEFMDLFTRNGFVVENVYAAQNMPFLYKFRFFRAKSHKSFDENLAREEGYKLSTLGNWLQKIILLAPNQFCNLFVLIAQKS